MGKLDLPRFRAHPAVELGQESRRHVGIVRIGLVHIVAQFPKELGGRFGSLRLRFGGPHTSDRRAL